MKKNLNLFIFFFCAGTSIIFAQIKSGVYKLDFKNRITPNEDSSEAYYSEEYSSDVTGRYEKWDIIDHFIIVFKENGEIKAVSLSEDETCIVYESKGNWTYNNNYLVINNTGEKYRENCDDTFTTSSPNQNETYEIIVIKDNYFIGHSKEDTGKFKRWVRQDKSQLEDDMSLAGIKKHIKQQKGLRLTNPQNKGPLESLILSGKWYINSITLNDKTKSLKDKNKNWMLFHTNGNCEIVMNDRVDDEIWRYNSWNDSMTMTFDRKNREVKIEKINDSKIVLSTTVREGAIQIILEKE